MNFLLKNIENHLDERSLLKGEQLLHAGKVVSMHEIEKHLWVSKIEDETTYETEAKISPSRVLAGTCECERYQDIGVCEHLAAMLLLLRRKKADKQREKKRRTKKTPKKLTTNVVLETASHDELVAFVRQYARGNRNFALALKARFAPKVPIEESKEKYLQLLDSTINMARKADRQISYRGSRKIYQILLEMQSQIEDAIVDRYFGEAFHMIQSIIEKISPILRKLEHLQEELREQLKNAFNALNEIIRQQPAPALQAEIWEYCLEESAKLRYRNNQLDVRFYRIMLSLADEADKKQQIVNKLKESLLKYEYEDRNPAAILLLQIQLLESLNQNALAESLIDRYLSQVEILLYAIRQALQKKDYPKAKLLAKIGLQKKPSAAVRAKLEEILLEIAEQEKDLKAISSLSFNRLLQSLDIRYADKIKRAQGDRWPERRSQILEKIRNLPFSFEKEELIGQILAEDQCWEALLAHLEDIRSLELLRRFDQYLLPDYRQEIYRLYRQILDDYLHNHLGRKPSTRIRQVLLHLNNLKAIDLVQELVEKFRTTYPERHTLMEELALF